MKNATTEQLLLSDNNKPDDEIDLRQVVGALARRWRWITGGGAIGLLLSALNLFLVKPVFKANFRSFSTRKIPKWFGIPNLREQYFGVARWPERDQREDSIATDSNFK